MRSHHATIELSFGERTSVFSTHLFFELFRFNLMIIFSIGYLLNSNLIDFYQRQSDYAGNKPISHK